MSNCIGLISYASHQFQFDHCNKIISYEVTQDSNFTKNSLIELSKACFDAYKFRLENISKNILEIGTEEYNLINKELISLILPFNPLKFSFSISEDPSLHFFIRFSKNISLFVEIFLDLEDGQDTYIQILKSGHMLYEANCMFDNTIISIQNVLTKEYYDHNSAYFNILKNSRECQPYQHGL